MLLFLSVMITELILRLKVESCDLIVSKKSWKGPWSVEFKYS